ncbi:MFS transporter [Hydrogenophaga sp. Root209]|uniref:MFS transporter n=1 Tax=unclassified Hydrogenophaga TaxID=2610897 RepID=UPI0006FDD89E|nr:MFS transporter [Hydrogenophaga sp. Root209]KRC10475.1 MFS transporter [Hydrogenophaga sp. Root209]
MSLAPASAHEPAARFIGAGAWRRGVAYGLLGLPLAFVALPLYVILPNHYAREFGAPLALLGLVLLAARLVDAVLDPIIGRWCDRLFARSMAAVLGASAVAAMVLALGLWGLLFPPSSVCEAGTTVLLSWAGLLMAITYTAYSVVAVAHQSWGARLGGNEAQRSRVVAWREGLSLLGVLIAAVLPTTLGLGATVSTFAVLLTLGWWAWSRSAAPIAFKATGPNLHLGASPLRQPAFLRLLAVFVINGTASAVPATLVLFFVQDRLQASPSVEPAFLATYFLCAALSIPLWVRLVSRLGLARTWLVGMALAVVVFIWAASLGAGDVVPFLIVCALSGIALGTDLTLPSAMLAGLIGQLGERGQREGAYFGWWSFATKLNLALAAGLALPLLALFGYEPGARDPAALQTLTIAYCLLPCALKLLAGGALYALVIRPERAGLVPHTSIPS